MGGGGAGSALLARDHKVRSPHRSGCLRGVEDGRLAEIVAYETALTPWQVIIAPVGGPAVSKGCVVQSGAFQVGGDGAGGAGCAQVARQAARQAARSTGDTP